MSHRNEIDAHRILHGLIQRHACAFYPLFVGCTRSLLSDAFEIVDVVRLAGLSEIGFDRLVVGPVAAVHHHSRVHMLLDEHRMDEVDAKVLTRHVPPVVIPCGLVGVLGRLIDALLNPASKEGKKVRLVVPRL